jgi:hypothetical protein
MVWSYGALRDDVRRMREAWAGELKRFDPLIVAGFIDLPAFAYAVAGRVQDRYAAIVLECLEVAGERDAVLKRYHAAKDSLRPLSHRMRNAIAEGRDADTAATLTGQLALLEALLVQRAISDSDWNLADEGFGRLEEEFWQLRAVADEAWQDEILDQILATSDVVISPEDRKFVMAHRDSDLRNPIVARRAEAIVSRAHAKLEPLWSFTVALCDALNRGENPMSPQDAWSLGLVDEVIGLPLTRRPLPRRTKTRLLEQLPVAISQEFY